MNCPKCGKEMRFGYITTQRQIWWIPNGEKLHSAFSKTHNEVKLKDISWLSLTDSPISAYICERCRKIIADY